MKIPLRMVQRDCKHFTDLLKQNPGIPITVVNGKGEMQFRAIWGFPGDVSPVKHGDKARKLLCDKCGLEYSDIRLREEDGVEYKVCAICCAKVKGVSFYSLKKI